MVVIESKLCARVSNRIYSQLNPNFNLEFLISTMKAANKTGDRTVVIPKMCLLDPRQAGQAIDYEKDIYLRGIQKLLQYQFQS